MAMWSRYERLCQVLSRYLNRLRYCSENLAEGRGAGKPHSKRLQAKQLRDECSTFSDVVMYLFIDRIVPTAVVWPVSSNGENVIHDNNLRQDCQRDQYTYL